MKKIRYFFVFFAGMLTMMCIFGFVILTTNYLKISTLDKANAIQLCKYHYGVNNLLYNTNTVICNDNYKPLYPSQNSNEEIYLIKTELDKYTILNITFLDWKNFKIKD